MLLLTPILSYPHFVPGLPHVVRSLSQATKKKADKFVLSADSQAQMDLVKEAFDHVSRGGMDAQVPPFFCPPPHPRLTFKGIAPLAPV